MLLLNLLQNPFYLIAFISALIIGITIHEFAHAYVADKCGDPTPRFDGRLTLNPLAHLDPMGTIFLFIAGFGWGKPVPINPSYFTKKSDELKVAFAGIVTNLLMATLLAIPIRVALANGVLIESSPILSFLNIIVGLNIILATFNLLPIPPLDGSHLVEYFLSEDSKKYYQYIGPFFLIGILIMDRFIGTSILNGILEPIIRFLSFVIVGTSSAF
jgi:Zn-dependent protease